MNIKFFGAIALTTAIAAISMPASAATLVLYSQDFENPSGFVNDGSDVNIYKSVNTLYGNQPPGFTFAQANTVETLLITGNKAFGTGYSDPSSKGGNYALGMLTGGDLLGLSFNVGSNQFLNARLDISSIDLSEFQGPFVRPGSVPTFEFTLYDNPSGTTGLGNGTILDVLQASGTASPRTVFDWTEVLLPLNASGSTNGNVTLRIDLLSGGYAALDNFRIAASDTAGDVGVITPVPPIDPPTETVPEVSPPPAEAVPEPTTMLGIALAGSGLAYFKRRKASV
ncbi:PEP-CTERM sorting domain-containing protein [Leptolyngbyaceae cyanobacterium UHCC 1019]